MKDILRQIIVLVTVLITIVVNIMANALPLNGLNTGEISDRFQVYFVPAGYVFAIWGLIYVGLIAYGIYQALPAQRENTRLQAIGWWAVLANLANTVWIFLWHYEQFPFSLVAMLTLLASLLIIYLRLNTGNPTISKAEKWAVYIPFSIYLGWITVATIANVTSLLDYLNWSGWGLSPEAWMVIMLAAVAIIGGLMNFIYKDIAYAAVLLWALAGIGVKFPSSGIVTIAVWVTFLFVAITFVWARLRSRSTVSAGAA